MVMMLSASSFPKARVDEGEAALLGFRRFGVEVHLTVLDPVAHDVVAGEVEDVVVLGDPVDVIDIGLEIDELGGLQAVLHVHDDDVGTHLVDKADALRKRLPEAFHIEIAHGIDGADLPDHQGGQFAGQRGLQFKDHLRSRFVGQIANRHPHLAARHPALQFRFQPGRVGQWRAVWLGIGRPDHEHRQRAAILERRAHLRQHGVDGENGIRNGAAFRKRASCAMAGKTMPAAKQRPPEDGTGSRASCPGIPSRRDGPPRLPFGLLIPSQDPRDHYHRTNSQNGCRKLRQ